MKRHFGLREAGFRWWAVLALLVGLAGFTYLEVGGERAPVATLAGQTMGTTYRVVLGAPLPRSEAGGLKQAIDARLAELSAIFSTYDPASELSRFNQHRSTQPFAVSEELLAVVQMAEAVSVASDGAFDVTVAPLVNAWGFGSEGRLEAPPQESEVAVARGHVGYRKLRVEGTRLRKEEPALEVDLSAIAKGYAVDEVAALLRTHGQQDHLVEIGGEVRASGRSARGEPFKVGIEAPDAHQRRVRLRLSLDDGAIATSGNYRNFIEYEAEPLGHTLDPATGRPVAHQLLSATVWHSRCALADAWATALMVVGPDRAFSLAVSQGLDVVLLLEGPKGDIQEQLTAGMASRTLDIALPGAR